MTAWCDSAYDSDDRADYYKDASALFTLTFEEEEDTELSQTAMVQVREALQGYSSYVYTTVDKDDAAFREAASSLSTVV